MLVFTEAIYGFVGTVLRLMADNEKLTAIINQNLPVTFLFQLTVMWPLQKGG